MSAPGSGWAQRPATSPAMELANDADSLQVNPGSPRTPLPPQSPFLSPILGHDASDKPSSSGTEDTDLKGTGLDEDEEDEDEDVTLEKVPEEVDRTLPSRFVLDPAGDLTYDETTVDVVTVPCPGGHALRSWNRDGLMSRYFGAPSMRDAEVNEAERPGPSWVRQGIRREADRSRILLYEHPAVVEGTTLNKLASSLLEELEALRTQEGHERPLVFIGHSIGGLVVKMALVKASRETKYENILRECYGVAFFGTPHQGSSYFAMPSLAPSIQGLLQLSAPLPPSLTHDLRVGNNLLLHVDEDFKTVSEDLRVWTFYETIDSRLSGGSSGDVYFTAPLTSIKSAILGMRQERIFPLQSDHANIASFGRNNSHTLRLFLKQLSAQIDRADANSREDAEGGAANGTGRWTLNLEQRVQVEVHGFFDDAASGAADGIVRAWSTRLPLREFLSKGPEACLSERLNEVDGPPEESRFLRSRGRTSLVEVGGGEAVVSPVVPIPFPPNPMTVKNALGIKQEGPQLQQQQPPQIPPQPLPLQQGQQGQHSMSIDQISVPSSPIILPVDAKSGIRTGSAPAMTRAMAGSPLTPPSRPISPPTRYSTPLRKPSPLIRAEMDQDLAIDRLSPPMRGRMGRSISRSMSLGSDGGGGSPRFVYRDFPPFSQRSRSTFDAAGMSAEEGDDDEDGLESPMLPEAIVAIRKDMKKGLHRASETVIVDEIPVAFAKPELKSRKFVWIHLPYNNPTWVTKILQTLQVSYKKDFSPLYNHDFWTTKHTRGRHSQHYAYFAKPGAYFTAPRTLSPRHSSVASPTLSPRIGDDAVYSVLFLPYLHFDSYKRLIRRRDLILKRFNHGRARPVPEAVAKSESVELQVIWEFLGHDPPINCRRTLDQYGYPSLRDTRSRDDDQMLYKLTKEREFAMDQNGELYSQVSSSKSGSYEGGSGAASWRDRWAGRDDESEEEAPEDKVLNGKVLIVDQMWLWTISTHTLLTFFPKRESDPIEGPLYQQADLRDSIFNEVNVDLTRQCENALDLAALAALHAVSVLLDRSSHPDLEIFRIFEEAISVLNERLTTSLKDFRAEGFRDKAFDYEPVENKEGSIRARHKEEGRRAERENRDNTSALLELRDIEDELLILLHLFQRQSKVISTMHAIYSRPELRERTSHGRVFLNEALKKLTEYIHLTDEMIRRVRSTRDDYDKLLQMVQRQAQVDEVRLSRLHADLASAQSRSVMIFTTFTVIFLPLTFFTGLFGMNTREWGGEHNLPIKTIGIIAVPSSVLMIITSLVIAWSTNVRRYFRWLARQYKLVARWLYAELWRPVSRTASKRLAIVMLAKKKRQRQRHGEEWESKGGGKMKKEASDFWERHRLERDKGYQIPEVNKAPGARKFKTWVKPKKDSKGK